VARKIATELVSLKTFFEENEIDVGFGFGGNQMPTPVMA